MPGCHDGLSLFAGSALAMALFFATASAHAGDPAAAREQVKIGYQLAKDGKCPEAIPHFVESIKLDIKAVTLINLASCEEKLGSLADALGHWVEARARAQIEKNAAIQDEAEKRATALERRIPRLTITLPAGAPGDATVLRDDVELGPASMGIALPVNPGSHSLVVRAKGHVETTASVSLAEGEQKTIALELGPAIPAPVPPSPAVAPRETRAEPTNGGTSPLVPIGFGAALAGVAVGSITGVMAFGKASEVDAGCPTPSSCSAAGLDAVSSGKTLGSISTVAFAVAGVGLAAGIYGLVWGKPSPKSGAAVGFGPMGGVLRGNF